MASKAVYDDTSAEFVECGLLQGVLAASGWVAWVL